jgi:hypothetical protein
LAAYLFSEQLVLKQLVLELLSPREAATLTACKISAETQEQ